MQANRRRFLSLLGVGAASAPLAAKVISDAEILNLTSARQAGALASGGMGLYSGGQPAAEQVSSEAFVPHEQRVIKAADYVKMFGLPKYVDAQLRDNAKYVHCLDPDIACKKSWSISVKIQEQRARNYQIGVARIQAMGWQERGRAQIKKLLGFEFPL